MKLTTIATSPFNCEWIVRDSAGYVGGFQYAVCCRVRGEDRIVSEVECARCPFWSKPEPPAGAAR